MKKVIIKNTKLLLTFTWQILMQSYKYIYKTLLMQ